MSGQKSALSVAAEKGYVDIVYALLGVAGIDVSTYNVSLLSFNVSEFVHQTNYATSEPAKYTSEVILLTTDV